MKINIFTRSMLLIMISMSAIFVAGFSFMKWYRLRSSIRQKRITHQVPACQYDLRWFDFHYRAENSKPNIIMLGNSLTRHGHWDSLLRRNDVINRGISGDLMKCMHGRLHFLESSPAKIVFVEGGINDIQHGVGADSVVRNYIRTVEYVVRSGRVPVINLVLYVSGKAGETFPLLFDTERINAMVHSVNVNLMSYADSTGIDVIDMNRVLSDEDTRQLKGRFTTDGVHLNRSAYSLWAIEINSVLKKCNI